MNTLGGFVRKERLKRNLTMRELGEQLGITSVYISDIENEKRIPRNGAVLKAFAKFFKIEFSDLQQLSDYSKTQRMLQQNSSDENQYQVKYALARSIFENAIDNDQIIEINKILSQKKEKSNA